MRDLIDRRGKGSATYGWAAWESRWAQIMAELVQRAGLLAAPERPSALIDVPGEVDEVEKQPQKMRRDQPVVQESTITDVILTNHRPFILWALAASLTLLRANDSNF